MLRCEMMMMIMMTCICVHGKHTWRGFDRLDCTFRQVYNPCFFPVSLVFSDDAGTKSDQPPKKTDQ